ncbi:MAG: aminoacetone oxidase family FAD-binding enzyme [Armatimonadetes bacterium]|nr:aminoacetone oxidase family FAD-binding enzyme [Armatimonadota bacterium]
MAFVAIMEGGMKPDVIVVGAGAAGIFAAWRAATLGAKVVLLEKTSRIGTKILVSGGGKCNICHDGPIEEVLAKFRPNEGRFIRPSVYRFPSTAIVPLFVTRGLDVYTRPDGRIFPVDRTAKDVVAILKSLLDEVGVTVFLDSPVEGLTIEDGRVAGVQVGTAERRGSHRTTDQPRYGAKALLTEALAIEDDHSVFGAGELRAPKVIVCCGGSSYPNSGTTGDGWKWMRDLGHTIVKTRAALAPLYLESVDADLSGVALRDVALKARATKEVARWRGDLLFTHQGISGPCALGVSRVVAETLESAEVSLEVDLCPDTSEDALREQALSADPKRTVDWFLSELLPDRLLERFLTDGAIPPKTTFANLDRKSRNRLMTLIKAWPIGKVRHVPLEKGEVVAGGVSLDEVDPKTMASRLVDGLYLCGEILDVAGPVGGYNLQAAFATGFVAGESAVVSVSGNA